MPRLILEFAPMKQARRTLQQVQGSVNRRSPGLVNYVPALAYHLCLDLPAAFTQPGDHLLAEPCIFFRVFNSLEDTAALE